MWALWAQWANISWQARESQPDTVRRESAQGRADTFPWVQFNSVQLLSRVQFFVTPWTSACQASLSIINSLSLFKLRWHHRLNGHGFGWAPGVGDGQGGLACCGSWGHRVRHDWLTELNWTCPLSWWCHPTISSSVVPFSSSLQSFPASGSFLMNQFFASSGQSIGVSASASVLPMNIQDWLPLGWTGWIILQSKGLSRVFSNTTVQEHQFSCTQLSMG